MDIAHSFQFIKNQLCDPDFGRGDRSVNTRSKRQIESLRHARDWHLSLALKAKYEGRLPEHDFHMRYYTLLGPAVEAEDLKEVKAGSTETRVEIQDAEF